MKHFFRELFADNNHINEKNVIGVWSFIVMSVYSLVDVITGAMGKELVISERIYTSFETIVLGAFIISAGEKITSIIKGRSNGNSEETNS
jgi:hypothetical protein